MICDQDYRDRMEILVKFLLSFSVIVLSIMKLLIKTFLMELFSQINRFKKVWMTFCVISLIQNMI